MKLLSLFSGIGAFEKALDRLNITYDLVGYCEIDKYASKSYAAIHGVPESMNIGDITKVNEKDLPKDIDLITYGFPCQDISLAGKQKGLFNEDGSKTRSGLFFEALRIIEETQPKVAIAENVKNLISKKFSAQFKIVLDALEEAGYNNYWQIMNAKNYGIPQNRERVFIVSIRKDVDNGRFRFPEGFPLKLRLKDMLDAVVDEKYYLSDATINKIANSKFTQENTRIQKGDVCQTLLARDYKNPKCVELEPERIGGIFDTETQRHQAGAIWNKDKISPTIDTMQGGYRQPMVLVDEPVLDKAFDIPKEILNDNRRQRCVWKPDGIAPTLLGTCADEKTVEPRLRIRKLTPKECFRLMDFDDEDFAKAEAVNSNTQLYKQAGNSIVVSCPYYIIKNLVDAEILKEKEEEMELIVKEYNPQPLVVENFEELKAEITCKAALYKSMVYTDETIKQAKADRALLNKFTTALETKRRDVKKQCLAPYESFEKQIKELVGIVGEPIKLIDDKVKNFEERQKAEKLEAIKGYFGDANIHEWLNYEAIQDSRWLNASVSMKKVQEDIDSKLQQIESDLGTLAGLSEFSFEAVEVYKTTLDINRAIAEGQRLVDIQKRKEEAARRKAEAEAARLKAEQEAEETVIAGTVTAEINVDGKTVPVEEVAVEVPAKQWIKFEALLSMEDATALAEFFSSRNINFRPI